MTNEDAIDAVQEHFTNGGFAGYRDGQNMMERIKGLPSAQPEIIRCKDCRYCIPNETFHTHWCRGRQILLDHFCGYAERRQDG